MALHLSFIGPPHCGKRTQALALRQNGFACAGSADLHRAAGGGGDDALFQAVGAFFNQHPGRALVLAGYPATVAQAARLAPLGLDAAVFFDASDATMLARLGPGFEDAEAYKQRLAAYRLHEAPLREFYTRAGIAHAVLAGYPQTTVRAQIADLIADLYVGHARRAGASGR